MPGATQRFQLVIDLLAAAFGEPHEVCDGVASWSLGPAQDQNPLHIACEPWEDGACARVWIFDPSARREAQVRCVRVVTRGEADGLIEELRSRLDRLRREAATPAPGPLTVEVRAQPAPHPPQPRSH